MGTTAAAAGRVAFTQKEPIGVVVAVSAFNHPLNLIVHQVLAGSRGRLPGDRQTGEHHAAVVSAARRAVARSGTAGRVVSGRRERSRGGRAARHRSPRGVLQFHRQRRGGLVAAFEARAGHALRAGTRRRRAGDHRAERRSGAVDQRRSEGRLLSRGAGVCVGAARVRAARAGARLGTGVGGSREAPEDRRSNRCCDRSRSADPAQRNEAHPRMGDGRGRGGRATVVRRRSAEPEHVSAQRCCSIRRSTRTSAARRSSGRSCASTATTTSIRRLRSANDLPFSFQAAIFTRDLDAALRGFKQLDASAVMVNDHTAFRVDGMPFAGLARIGPRRRRHPAHDRRHADRQDAGDQIDRAVSGDPRLPIGVRNAE